MDFADLGSFSPSMPHARFFPGPCDWIFENQNVSPRCVVLVWPWRASRSVRPRYLTCSIPPPCSRDQIGYQKQNKQSLPPFMSPQDAVLGWCCQESRDHGFEWGRGWSRHRSFVCYKKNWWSARERGKGALFSRPGLIYVMPSSCLMLQHRSLNSTLSVVAYLHRSALITRSVLSFPGHYVVPYF